MTRRGQVRGILSLRDLSQEAMKAARNEATKIEVSYTDVAETLGHLTVPNTMVRAARAS